MASPRDLVLTTPELLESILLHLSPHHLLAAQLISQIFRNTITSSPSLQHRLFFRPDPTRPPKQWLINPLLRHHFLPWFVMPGGRGAIRNYHTLKRMDWVSSASRLSAFLRKDASWRNMLLMQPSPNQLHVVRWVHGQAGDSASNAAIPFPNDAVTMGLVYDLTERFLRDSVGSYPSFGPGFKDGVAGPMLTLYFRMTMQCCPSDDDEAPVLRSEGADEGLVLEWKDGEGAGSAEERSDGRMDMKWRTDLTGERGGVEVWEWKEWLRKRAPMSDLSSDVR
jgi:hypothetical protein